MRNQSLLLKKDIILLLSFLMELILENKSNKERKKIEASQLPLLAFFYKECNGKAKVPRCL